jgi:non-heme chloroperoxidase
MGDIGSSFTTDDGVRLNYLSHGDPAGRPVVLVAGFKAPATSWAATQKSLGRAGYRVLSLDRRGHGASEKTAAGASMQQHGADLAAFVERLALEHPVLVGGSMGGNTIWSTVSQRGDAVLGGGLGGIVIVDQTPKMLGSADWPFGFYDYDASNRDTLFAETVPDPGRVSLASKGPVRIARLVKAMRGGGERTLSAPEKELLNDHAKADWRAAIASTTVPVLFVAGRESEFWPCEHAAASAALAPRGTSVVLERAGHAASIEQPAAFDEALLGFLRTARG